MKTLTLALVMLTMGFHYAQSQDAPTQVPGLLNRSGRWSLGLHGGGNLWVNDFDTRKIAGTGDLTLRYALSRKFSLGIMAGYEALQSTNTKDIEPNHPALQHSYVETKGVSGDLVAWYHFSAGSTVTPYAYLGVGGYMYKRKVEGNQYFTENKNYTSFHIPVGLGLEIAASKHAAITLDLGARVLDDHTDNWVGAGEGGKDLSGTDWYPTARAGVNFYFGSSDDDDNDGDGLTNGQEKSLGTDPNKADTDGDGLTDGQEVNTYKTDPKKADSDNDGLKDGEEVNGYKTNPNIADTDGDGLSDGDEVLKYKTDPLKADTDGDGLTDGQEVNQYKTDPLKADTDGDGLSDGQEVNQYKTDPLKADSDNGSVNDGQEIANGTNPLDPTDDVRKPKIEKMEVGKAIILEGIVFKTGKATIEPQSEETLMGAFNTLKENAEIAVEIRGYTDNVGKATANKKLSQRRAEAVRMWLVRKGVDAKRVSAKGFGQENPIGDNKSAEGRAKNRRTEFFRTR